MDQILGYLDLLWRQITLPARICIDREKRNFISWRDLTAEDRLVAHRGRYARWRRELRQMLLHLGVYLSNHRLFPLLSLGPVSRILEHLEFIECEKRVNLFCGSLADYVVADNTFDSLLLLL